jgi:hypothetical protein
LTLLHNCAVLGVPAGPRLLAEPWGDYHLALSMVCDMVADTNRQAELRAQQEARRG